MAYYQTPGAAYQPAAPLPQGFVAYPQHIPQQIPAGQYVTQQYGAPVIVGPPQHQQFYSYHQQPQQQPVYQQSSYTAAPQVVPQHYAISPQKIAGFSNYQLVGGVPHPNVAATHHSTNATPAAAQVYYQNAPSPMLPPHSPSGVSKSPEQLYQSYNQRRNSAPVGGPPVANVSQPQQYQQYATQPQQQPNLSTAPTYPPNHPTILSSRPASPIKATVPAALAALSSSPVRSAASPTKPALPQPPTSSQETTGRPLPSYEPPARPKTVLPKSSFDGIPGGGRANTPINFPSQLTTPMRGSLPRLPPTATTPSGGRPLPSPNPHQRQRSESTPAPVPNRPPLPTPPANLERSETTASTKSLDGGIPSSSRPLPSPNPQLLQRSESSPAPSRAPLPKPPAVIDHLARSGSLDSPNKPVSSRPAPPPVKSTAPSTGLTSGSTIKIIPYKRSTVPASPVASSTAVSELAEDLNHMSIDSSRTPKKATAVSSSLPTIAGSPNSPPQVKQAPVSGPTFTFSDISKSTPSKAKSVPPPIPVINAPEETPSKSAVPTFSFPDEETPSSIPSIKVLDKLKISAAPTFSFPDADGHDQSVSANNSISSSAKLSAAPAAPDQKPNDGLIRCERCQNIILGQLYKSNNGKKWHPDCFRCNTCDARLEHVSSYEHEGKQYCHFDYHELFTHRCHDCKTPIVDERFFTIDDPELGKRYYHELHFWCCECGTPFLNPSKAGQDDDDESEESVSKFVVHKGHPYCEGCHIRLHMPKCTACRKPMTGDVVGALGGKYHAECLVCGGCSKPFPNFQFFEHQNQPWCATCYEDIA